VIFVTHDMGAVREYCDEAILIKDGLITHKGKADMVADEYLKLFNNTGAEEDDSEGKRWGNGAAKFTSIKAKADDKNVTVTINLKASENLEDVVVGFRLKDGEDKLVAGANTINVKGGHRFPLKEKENKKLVFTMPNIFGNGTFSISATIRLSDKITICEDWTDAAFFRNTKEESSYPVVCPAELTVE
jgi:ABC-type glutathione transport system ATPase component